MLVSYIYICDGMQSKNIVIVFYMFNKIMVLFVYMLSSLSHDINLKQRFIFIPKNHSLIRNEHGCWESFPYYCSHWEIAKTTRLKVLAKSSQLTWESKCWE